MNQLEFTVTGNSLSVTQDACTTGGSVNYDKCCFTFDSDWTDFTRTAVFGIGRDSFRVPLDENDECFIPSPCTEKEGIITVGVFGTNEDTVIATNAVSHHIEEGVDGLGEWFEEDYSLVLNAVSRMEGRVAEALRNLNENFDSIMRTLRREGTLTAESVSADCPDEWYIPSEFSGAEDFAEITEEETVDAYLDYGFNHLVRDFPLYVRREEIGTDESGDNPVYAYIFEPANYEKTVLVTSCIHGGEEILFFGLSNFFSELCRKSDGDRTLSYLKNRVKFVVVPIVNPYAMVERSLYNENNVDVGYNFPYKWDICTKSHIGDEAGDQQEAENLIEFAELISTDRLCAAVDFHIGMYAISGKSIYYPRFQNNCVSALAEFLNRFNCDAEDDELKTGIFAPSILPTFTNYLAYTYGINTCEGVWPEELYGGLESDENMTKLTEFIGNLLYTMAKNSSFTCRCSADPFVKYISWRGDDGYSIPQAVQTSRMGISNCSFTLSAPCIFSMQGYVVLDVSEECTVKINPVLSQVNSPEQTYNERKADGTFALELPLGAGTHVIPISSVLQAYYTSYNDSSHVVFCEDVRFCLEFCASEASAAEVTAFSLCFSGTPSDLGRCVEISSPVGEAADYAYNESPVQQIIYPQELFLNTDKKYDD